MYMEIGQYLNARLVEMGVRHVFGVAGDFNLSYLEQIIEEKELQFIGNCNELNGAYAADGYARCNGFSALVTTYGVGDLSAINGVAGAYAENVPVIHISGIPPLHAVNRGDLIHHTLIDGNYDNIMNCMREFTVAQARLTPENAGLEIDRVLRQCFLSRRPVYIQLPSDITHFKIKAPKIPLDLTYPKGDSTLLEKAVGELSQRIKHTENPVLLIDNAAEVFGVTDILQMFSKDYQIPYVCLPTSKHIMDEKNAAYLGVYAGAASQPEIRSAVEDSDCLIGIGVRFSDAATGFFTHDISRHAFIDIQQYNCHTAEHNYAGLGMRALLTGIHQYLKENDNNARELPMISASSSATPTTREIGLETALTQETLWKQVEGFLENNDIIIGEIGTSNAGLSGISLPKLAHYISQPLWGSIGYTLPALLGAMYAKPDKRHLLFIGDGSFQLTAQELSTMVRHDLKPIIFILNNGGYTIERLILGEHALYNDIQDWKYRDIVPVFNGKGAYQSFKVTTGSELKSTLEAIQNSDVFTVVEVVLDPMDAPKSLKVFGEIVARYDYGDDTYEKIMKES